MDARCNHCGRPATWHAAWQTPTMSEPTVAYACDEHGFEGMTPLDEHLGPILEHLPARGDVGEVDDEDDYAHDVDDEGDVDDEREIDDEDDGE